MCACGGCEYVCLACALVCAQGYASMLVHMSLYGCGWGGVCVCLAYECVGAHLSLHVGVQGHVCLGLCG